VLAAPNVQNAKSVFSCEVGPDRDVYSLSLWINELATQN
jgi:hypothetical protein